MTKIFVFIILMILIVLDLCLSKALRKLLKKDEPDVILAFYWYSVLFSPSKHFDKKNLVEGYILNLIMIVLSVCIVILFLALLA